MAEIKFLEDIEDGLKSVEDYKSTIICGDCIEVMKKFPNESVDLIITSPPYNLKNSTGNGMKNGNCGKWENA
jgi:modification methylase